MLAIYIDDYTKILGIYDDLYSPLKRRPRSVSEFRLEEMICRSSSLYEGPGLQSSLSNQAFNSVTTSAEGAPRYEFAMTQ